MHYYQRLFNAVLAINGNGINNKKYIFFTNNIKLGKYESLFMTVDEQQT